MAGADMLQITMPAAAPDGAQYIECERGGSIEFYVDGNGAVYDHGDVMIDGSIDVNCEMTRAGDFASNYLSSNTHVMHSEFTGTGTYDGVAVYGRSVPTDYYGYCGYFEGGYYGVYASVEPTGSSSYRGVYGRAYGGTGYNYGVRGYAYGGGTNYGVYGTAGGGGTNYAGYFSGNVIVSGTLSKGAGSFKIDHPLQPETKYLYHSFVESPDMMNVYNGNVVLDASGAGWVEMAGWFEAVNADFRYQLTAIGAPGPNLYFAEKNRIPVEEDKPAREVGKYLHPDAYGMPATMSVDYVEERRPVAPEEEYVDPREGRPIQGIGDDATD